MAFDLSGFIAELRANQVEINEDTEGMDNLRGAGLSAEDKGVILGLQKQYRTRKDAVDALAAAIEIFLQTYPDYPNRPIQDVAPSVVEHIAKEMEQSVRAQKLFVAGAVASKMEISVSEEQPQ